jgi:hypothetical protein
MYDKETVKKRRAAEADNRDSREAAKEAKWKKNLLSSTEQSIMDASK